MAAGAASGAVRGGGDRGPEPTDDDRQLPEQRRGRLSPAPAPGHSGLPDHDTIAAFRRRFLPQIEALFVQVLLLAREMGVLQMGTVALDGTKIHANASRHSALSFAHAGQIETQLRAEVTELLATAEAADGADLPDGLSIPEELARREQRLAEIARARAVIEARARERHAREQAEYEAKMAARAAKAAATGQKPRGRAPV